MTNNEKINAVFFINKIYTNIKNIDVITSKTIFHVYNNLFKFYDFCKFILFSNIQVKLLMIFILNYKSIRVFIIFINQFKKMLKFYDVEYCVNFVCNLIFIKKLNRKQI